jgi:hypothetical protein
VEIQFIHLLHQETLKLVLQSIQQKQLVEQLQLMEHIGITHLHQVEHLLQHLLLLLTSLLLQVAVAVGRFLIHHLTLAVAVAALEDYCFIHHSH